MKEYRNCNTMTIVEKTIGGLAAKESDIYSFYLACQK